MTHAGGPAGLTRSSANIREQENGGVFAPRQAHCTETMREKISPPRPLGFVTVINASTEELHNAAVTTPTPTRRVVMESKLEISEQNQRRN